MTLNCGITMLKFNVSASEAISILLTTALISGGIYLLGFIITILAVSPLIKLLLLLILNVSTILFYLSTSYAKMVYWFNGYIGQALDYIGNSKAYRYAKRVLSKTYNTVMGSKAGKWIQIALVFGAIQLCKVRNVVVSAYDYVVGKIKLAFNAVKSVVAKPVSWIKDLFSKSAVSTEAITVVNAEFVL